MREEDWHKSKKRVDGVCDPMLVKDLLTSYTLIKKALHTLNSSNFQAGENLEFQALKRNALCHLQTSGMVLVQLSQLSSKRHISNPKRFV